MKISKRMVLSSIVCVLPLVVSALLYRQLPNQMPIHWNSVGEANGFIEKNIGAWGIPLFMLAIHLVVAIKTENDKSKQHLSVITKGLCFWAVPLASVIFVPLSLFKAAGYGLNITKLSWLLSGYSLLLQVIIFPKTSQTVLLDINYRGQKTTPITGIKLIDLQVQFGLFVGLYI